MMNNSECYVDFLQTLQNKEMYSINFVIQCIPSFIHMLDVVYSRLQVTKLNL